MTFLGRGDLAPRRRPRRWPRRLAVLGVVLVVAAAAGYAWRDLRPRHTARAQVPPCPKPTTVSLPLAASPGGVAVRILTTTPRTGLAHGVQTDLAKRGFTVAGVGNAAPQVRDVAEIRYSPGALGAARLVAEQFAGQPRLVEDARSGKAVVVRIGDGFTRLATPAEASAAHTHDLAVRSPVPRPAPTASCRGT